MRYDLAIVIVNWNAGDYLLQCLRKLPGAVGNLATETFVVDNASSDGSPDRVVREFPSVRLIRNEKNLGFGRGNNVALEHTRAPWIAFVNPDLELPPGSLSELVEFLKENPRTGIVGPKIVKPDGRIQSEPFRFPRLTTSVPVLGRLFPQDRGPRRSQGPVQCDYVHGSCFVARRCSVEEIGGIPDITFLYGEEILLGHYLRERGWQVGYDPRVEALHHDDISTDQRWNVKERYLMKRASRLRVMAEINSRPRFLLWNTLSLIGAWMGWILQEIRQPNKIPYASLASLHIRGYRHVLPAHPE